MTTSPRRFNTIILVFNTLVGLIPLALLLLTLRLNGVWPDAIAAWRGEYINLFFSQIENPWWAILSIGAGLVLVYGLCVGLAFKSIRITPHSRMFRFRKWIGSLLLIIASAIFFVALVLALLAHNEFGDFLLGGSLILPPLVVIAMPLIVLVVNYDFLRHTDDG